MLLKKNGKKQVKRGSLLAGASVFAAAAALTATPAIAQDAEEEEAIVVTGTRLVRQDFEAISPITTVSADQLELTATLTTESLLNELPQIVPGNTRTSNNSGGESFATLDLRGLGPQRTLILVNGERIPASSTTGVVDINTIPASLISRVEVVTGGASAVYGSDAIGGVVNFVLKDDFEGGEVNITYGAELETGNVAEFEINGLVGGNFANGRGNMTTYASYYSREGVLQSEYDYSRVSGAICYDAVNQPANQAYYLCDSVSAVGSGTPTLQGGSGTPPWGWIANQPNFDITGDGIPDLGTGNPFGNPQTYTCQSAVDLLDDGVCNNSEGNGTPASAAPGNRVVNVGGYANPLNFGNFAAGVRDANCDGVPEATAFTPISGATNISFHPVTGVAMPRNNGGVGNLCSIPRQDFSSDPLSQSVSSRYNFAPDNFLVIPAERISLASSGHYDITDDVTLSLLTTFNNSRTDIRLAPTPATGIGVTMTPATRSYIQANHPDLWQVLATRPNPYGNFTMDRRTTELGTRTAFNENNAFFFYSALDGSLGENWDWNLMASYGQSTFVTRLQNSANRTALAQGLAGCQSIDPGPDNVANTADDIGVPLVGALPGCVQVDIFGPNTLDTNMVDFIRANTFSQTIVEENRLGGFVRGDLFQLPAGPIAAVFGFEYRDTQLEFHVDNEQRTGNIYGFNALQDQLGAIDVYELYTEIAVPLITEATFAHYLGLELGYRRSNYSTVGNVDTYKIGAEWAPTEWLRFRGVFNAATRAPNVFELFQAGDQGFPAYIDPCNETEGHSAACNAAAGPARLPLALQGGFQQNNAQVQAFAFGNPNLSAESAESLTYGVVFQPDWFPVGDLRATVDYYDINITDVIAGFGAQFYLDDCYIDRLNAADSCSRITRDPASGQVLTVETSRSNQAVFTTTGIDAQIEWSVPIGPGQLTINELYSYLDTFQFNGGEFAGTTSAGVGGRFPDFKSTLSIAYNVGDWTLFGRWSYVPEARSNAFGVVDDGEPGLGDDGSSPPCPGSPGGCGAVPDFVDDPTVSPEASYFDVSARWNVTDAFSLTVNVDNILDDLPPQTADNSQANTDPQVYRVLGRTFAISGRYRF